MTVSYAKKRKRMVALVESGRRVEPSSELHRKISERGLEERKAALEIANMAMAHAKRPVRWRYVRRNAEDMVRIFRHAAHEAGRSLKR